MSKHTTESSSMFLTLRRAALEYAKKGIPVFPTNGKVPAIRTDEGGRGFHDATTDIATIEGWFTAYGDRINGLATPTGHGLFVLDVDAHHGGGDTLTALMLANELLPQTREVRTGQGGQHFWFRYDPNILLPKRDNIAKGIDIKADGACAHLPPSVHQATQFEYVWTCPLKEDQPIAEVPDWLWEWIIRESKKDPVPFDYEPVAKIEEGGRNTFLFKRARRMSALGLSEELVIRGALELNERLCIPPLLDKEVRVIAHSAVGYGANPAHPSEIIPFAKGVGKLPIPGVHVPMNGAVHADGQPVTTETQLEQLHLLTYTLTDSGNADRFSVKFSNDFFFDRKTKEWGYWNGKYWDLEDDTIAQAMMRAAMEHLNREIEERAKTVSTADEEAQKFQEMLEKYGLRCLDTRTIEHGVKRVAALRHHHESTEDMNQDLYLLNANNGTLHLKTGIVHAHQRTDKLTHMLPYDYDATLTCPLFTAFLYRAFGWVDGDKESYAKAAEYTAYVFRCLGYALSGDTTEKSIFIFHGPRNTGKTTFMNIVKKVFGSYAREISIEALMAGDGTKNYDEQVFSLRGARLAHATEPEGSKLWSGRALKSLVQGGRSSITVTPKYKHAITIKETWKIMIDTNHEPRFRDTTDDVWERIRYIPFSVPIKNVDTHFEESIDAEIPGILARCVEGFQDYRERKGLDEPQDAIDRKQEVRKGNHPLNDLFDECYLKSRPDPALAAVAIMEIDADEEDERMKLLRERLEIFDLVVPVKDLWERYAEIQKRNSKGYTMRQEEFKKALESEQIEQKRGTSRTDRRTLYHGITLRTAPEVIKPEGWRSARARNDSDN